MAAKEVAVKKYVVRLSADERAQLDDLIHTGKRSAQLLTKARILLKADVSEAGEGWSDSRIAAALDVGIATIQRTRRQNKTASTGTGSEANTTIPSTDMPNSLDVLGVI